MNRQRTLYITIGISGSGKSTWAKEQQAARPDEVRIVTMDDWRFASGSQFCKADEKVVKDANEFFIESWLNAGYDVIVADTNLGERNRRRWAQIAQRCSTDDDRITVQDMWFDVELQVCISRVHDRHDSGGHDVPEHVIRSQHENYTRQRES
jgi:predicted kinase